MSSDSDLGKKEEEREALYPFLEAYPRVTGQVLSIVGEGENPDFICLRPAGEPVGIELSKVMRT
jgi:hypothetical protein